MTHIWYLYVIRCKDGSLYTGITIDVARRLKQHESNKGARYLKGRGPLELIFSIKVGEKSMALRAEQKIKRLPKKKKETVSVLNLIVAELLEWWEAD